MPPAPCRCVDGGEGYFPNKIPADGMCATHNCPIVCGEAVSVRAVLAAAKPPGYRKKDGAWWREPKKRRGSR